MSRRRRRERKPQDRSGRSIPDILYPTLDLHGLTAEEAVRKCERWLVDRHREGEPTVRAVTGRGMHSVGPPVLPSAVEELLQRLKGNPVRSFEREPGGGAFRIDLVQSAPRSSASVSAARQPTLDPELVRLAEESLWELGIEPTPPLIEAEVRRIVKGRSNERG